MLGRMDFESSAAAPVVQTTTPEELGQRLHSLGVQHSHKGISFALEFLEIWEAICTQQQRKVQQSFKLDLLPNDTCLHEVVEAFQVETGGSLP